MMRVLQTAWLTVALAMAGQLSTRAATEAVVQADRVNVRARPTLRSEVVTQLQTGARVVVRERIRPDTPPADEAADWTQIALPAAASGFVFRDYVDARTHRVTARRLNVRAGAGERFTVLGRLQRGDVVKPRRTKGDWLEIDPPSGTVGYVASRFLRFQSSAPEPSVARQSAPAASVSPTEAKPVAPAPVPKSPAAPAPASAPKAKAEAVPEPEPIPTSDPVDGRSPIPAVATRPRSAVIPPAGPVVDVLTAPAAAKPVTSDRPVYAPEPTLPVTPPPVGPWAASPSVRPDVPPPTTPPRARVAIREGVVRGTLSIQAPGPYELRRSDSGERVVYLYPARPGIALKPFRKERVRVRGREYLDPRWPRCAVLLVERITLAP